MLLRRSTSRIKNRTQFGATIRRPDHQGQNILLCRLRTTQRDESGFFTSDVVGNLTASATIPVIAGLNPVARTFTNLTAAQAAAINSLVASGNSTAICGARAYAFFASSGGQTALTGSNPLLSPNDGSLCPAISPITPGAIGPRFILSGAPVPTGTTMPMACRSRFGLSTVCKECFRSPKGQTTFQCVATTASIQTTSCHSGLATTQAM